MFSDSDVEMHKFTVIVFSYLWINQHLWTGSESEDL